MTSTFKQVTIIFDDKGQGFDIKVFLPDVVREGRFCHGREIKIDIIEEEDVREDDGSTDS